MKLLVDLPPVCLTMLARLENGVTRFNRWTPDQIVSYCIGQEFGRHFAQTEQPRESPEEKP